MCGLAGILAERGVGEGNLRQMIAAVRHRGPDDNGAWIDESAGIGLGHARLSIIDVSPAGHQPMASASGRFVIAFNGEIYNHLDLRRELAKAGADPRWRGHSDTETLLACFEAWGLEATVRRAVGMFAFAAWDRNARELTLARDRVGEKPLYYGWLGDCFLFGSELKALRAHPACETTVDRQALALLLRHNYIPAPYSIYRGIAKVEPGTMLKVALERRTPNVVRYWDVRTMVEQGREAPFDGSPADAVADLEELLRQAVRRQMMSDVPLGAFLSGGVDSSAIVAMMQAEAGRPINTFTIGFEEEAYNEAGHAKAVAKHLGTAHTELIVSPRDALEVVPQLPGMFCEPFSDSSQIPTFMVSRLARSAVTVVLSGDAGDELFAGYSRYALAERLWNRFAQIPKPLRKGLSRLAGMMSTDAGWSVLSRVRALSPVAMRALLQRDRIGKAATLLGCEDTAGFYRTLVSHWADPAAVVIGGEEHRTVLDDPSRQPETDGLVHEMMALDFLSYLPDDILVKVDRAAMAVSLETRVPLLDPDLVEFAWRLPLDYKVRAGIVKWPLREVLYKYVPARLIDRPKMGFGVPIETWLRGPLREWGEALLDESRLRQEGFFHPAPIRKCWRDHLSGRQNSQYRLWDVLMFQAWLSEAK